MGWRDKKVRGGTTRARRLRPGRARTAASAGFQCLIKRKFQRDYDTRGRQRCPLNIAVQLTAVRLSRFMLLSERTANGMLR